MSPVPDAGRDQREAQRVRSAADADAMLRIAVLGEIRFKALHHRPADESGRVQRRARTPPSARLSAPRGESLNPEKECFRWFSSLCTSACSNCQLCVLNLTHYSGGISRDDRIGRNVPASPRCPRRRSRVLANGHVGQNGRARTDRRAFLHQRASPLSSPSRSAIRRPRWSRADRVSLMKATLWPTKTLSSMVTPSQTKVWLEILQRAPTLRVLLNFDEGADLACRRRSRSRTGSRTATA